MRLGIACGSGSPPGEVLDLLEAAGLQAGSLRGMARPALLRHAGGLWLLGSSADVLRGCDRAALDAGVVGSDRLLEDRCGATDLLDLGCCRDDLVFSVAEAAVRRHRRMRVATRHPETARSYFAAAGVQAEILALDEPALAPGLGLAEGVVELRSRLAATSPAAPETTERGVVAVCSARLVAGRAARVLLRDEVNALADRLRAALEER